MIGRSREEQELNQLLSKTLVQKQVIEPMEKIGWNHGTPPPASNDMPNGDGRPAAEGAPGQAPADSAAPAAGRPAPADGTAPPADQSKTDPSKMDLVTLFESLRDPDTGLIARKYRTVEEAIKGGAHLANMAKESFSQRDAAIERLRALESEVLTLRQTPAPTGAAPAPSTTTAPSRARLAEAEARLEKVLSDVAENGGVLDLDTGKILSKAQREVAEAVADLRVEEKFASHRTQEDADEADWRRVDSYMKEHHPDAARFADEVALFVQSSPLLAKAVDSLMKSNDRLAATELAWTTFQTVHGAQVSAEVQAQKESKESDLAAREQVRKEQVEQARKDAGVVTGSAGGTGVHEGARGRASAEEVAAVRNRMRLEGDAPGSPAAQEFRRMIIGPSLDPSLFGPI